MTEAVVEAFKTLLEDQKVKDVKALRNQLIENDPGYTGDTTEQLSTYVEPLGSLIKHIPPDSSFDDWKRILLNDHRLMNSFPKSFWDQVDFMLKAAGIKTAGVKMNYVMHSLIFLVLVKFLCTIT